MIVCAIFSVLLWLCVTLLTHGIGASNGFYYELSNSDMPFGSFLILYTIIFIVYLYVVYKVQKKEPNLHNVLVVFIVAVLARLILLPSVPIHENDVYRYIWDGKVALSGINPYKYSPQQAQIKPENQESQAYDDFLKLKELRDENRTFYNRIGYKDVSTIYPPLTQFVFMVSTFLGRGSIWFMKFLFILFDLAAIFLIYKILQLLKLNPLNVVIYAWSPLVLKEFANSGHYDSVAILCVVASVYFILSSRTKIAGVMMGLGVLSKFYPLIFVPFFLKLKQYKSFIIALSVSVIGYLPFFAWGRTNLLEIFSGLNSYTKSWSINGFIFEMTHSTLSLVFQDPYISSKILCAICFVIFWFVVYIKRTRPGPRQTWTKNVHVRRGPGQVVGGQGFPPVHVERGPGYGVLWGMFLVVVGVFLFSPVGDAWYFCWVIPFLCIFRSYSLIVLSYLLIFSYFDFTREFGLFVVSRFEIKNILLTQYLPFYLLLGCESYVLWKKGQCSNTCAE